MDGNRFGESNRELLRRLSIFLNQTHDFIEPEIIRSLTEECGLDEKTAFSMVLASAIGLEIDRNPSDKALYSAYFPEMIKPLDTLEFEENPYYRTVYIPAGSFGRWEMREEAYRPYEAFVCDDFLLPGDGRMIPQIGFFRRAFRFPAVLENGREWMLITPNEINTMKEPIAEAKGRVLTYGLGLGYYAFMVSAKPEVSQVTVVERDPEIISLFRRFLLPQFPAAEKIRLVRSDAFSYAEQKMPGEHYDFVFTDLWHDPSDGVPLYRRMKQLEPSSPGTKFAYWIEKTLRCYL